MRILYGPAKWMNITSKNRICQSVILAMHCFTMKKQTSFYNVKFGGKREASHPGFIKANELDTYKLELPDAGAVENISLKRNSDSPIVISSKDDVENIRSILEETEPTAESGRDRYSGSCGKHYHADFISKRKCDMQTISMNMGKHLLSRRTTESIYDPAKEGL